MLLEEKFYVSEYGFNFIVKTGINTTGTAEGDLKAVIKRPDQSVAVKTIPLANISDAGTGTVLFPIAATDLTIPGRYEAQVFIRIVGSKVRPSHTFEFDVHPPIGDTVGFPWT